MRYLIFGLILLGLSIYLGIEISQTHNTVMIVIGHWVIEASLWVALLGVLILFALFYLFFRLLSKIFGISKQFQHWKKGRRAHKARVLTHMGLCELAEGNWKQAEETLLKAARHSRRPLIDYLAAAKAAQAQHAFDRRDTYLRRAHQNDKQATLAIGLTQAELQIESQQWEQALATLQHLQQQAPTHSYIMKLLAKVYVELKEWSQCQQLLTPLKRADAMTKKDFFSLARKVYLSLLTEAATKELAILEATWKSLPKEYQRDSKFIYAYVDGLLTWKQDEASAELIISHQKHHWDSALTELFGRIRYENKARQLEIAERWQQKHPNDTTLLMTLGELCAREKLWGKAEAYLKRSLSNQPSVMAYLKLSNVYEAMGEGEQAQACFKKTVNLISSTANQHGNNTNL